MAEQWHVGHDPRQRSLREHAISALQAAFAQGRLAKDEFDARVGQALASRSDAELAAVIADLPAGPAVARPGSPAQGHRWLTMKRAVTCTACMVIPTAMAAVIGALSGFPETILSFLAFFVATVAGGTMISTAWDNRRSRG